ncbi:MAG: class I SAM-dependent methyltransferase [Candidatus Micrarchaeota archaeon]
MTNGQKAKPTGTHEQYGPNVARVWDKLVDWEKREKAYGDFFAKLLSDNGAKRILDMSTGSGFDSILLLKSGFEVTSLDGSSAMIEVAKENAKKHGLLGHFASVVADWRSIGSTFSTKFEGIICLGNSICHLNEMERGDVFRQIRGLLKQGGLFIVDYRNYNKILAGEKTGKGGYYLGEATINLNVEEGQVRPDYTISSKVSFSLSFNPIPIKTAIAELAGADFSITVYSDFREGLNPDAAFYQLIGKTS